MLTPCRAVGLGVEEALRYEGVTVLSVDLSEDMVRRASERNAAAVSQVSVAMITSNSHSTLTIVAMAGKSAAVRGRCSRLIPRPLRVHRQGVPHQLHQHLAK